MAQPLETRITAALRSSSRIKDVEATIADVAAEIGSTQKKYDLEAARSIDPSLTTPQAREARNNAADLEHDIRRLNASLDLLRARRQTILDDESYAQRVARYQSAKTRRDELAQDIRARYPAIALELLEMIKRLNASDDERAKVNLDRPRNAPQLESAEHVARECGAFWSGQAGPVSSLRRISLPFLMRSGNYLPLQTSNVTQNADMQRVEIENDQKDAKRPLVIEAYGDA